MRRFKVGTRVFVTNTALRDSVGIGTVVNVIPSDSGLPDFTLYDVKFASGLRTLHGSELTAVHISFSRCDLRERLRIAAKRALDNYVRAVWELSSSAGKLAHADFELLDKNAETAKQVLTEARRQLDEHTAEHGC